MDEAATRRRRRLIYGGLVGFLLVLPLLAEAAGQGFYISFATRVLILALAASSLNLILGYGGLVSFGHAAYVGIGGYVVGIAFVHAGDGTPILGLLPGGTDALVLLAAAMAVSGLVAAVIGAICLRTRGVAFIMITLAFAQMLFFFLVSLRRYNGEDGIAVWQRSTLPGPLDLNEPVQFYYLVLGLLLALLYGLNRLVASRFGRALRAARDNEGRAQALGFSTFRYQLTAFVLAGAVAGLAGALLVNATGFVAPSYLHWTRSGDLIVMVVLGGMGTIAGPTLGAAALMGMEEFLPELIDALHDGAGDYWKIVLGPLLIVIVLFARRGLAGVIEAAAGAGALRLPRLIPRRPGQPPRRRRTRR